MKERYVPFAEYGENNVLPLPRTPLFTFVFAE